MERTVKDETGQRSWRKVGGGSFYLKGRIIKPNQVFTAELAEIPEGFRDVVIPVDGKPVTLDKVEDIPDVPVTELVFTIRDKGGNWYEVLDSNGKVMNEKSLRKAQADELIKELTT